jgi:hypothetical protein
VVYVTELSEIQVSGYRVEYQSDEKIMSWKRCGKS